MLVGIVKKNAIMMINFALDAPRHDSKSALEAISYGCLIRFHPVMMTTMAALMGILLIALASAPAPKRAVLSALPLWAG